MSTKPTIGIFITLRLMSLAPRQNFRWFWTQRTDLCPSKREVTEQAWLLFYPGLSAKVFHRSIKLIFIQGPPSFNVLLPMTPIICHQLQSKNTKWKTTEISFQVLSSTMNSCTVLLCPIWDVNHPFVQCIHTVYATHPLVIISGIRPTTVLLYCLCSKTLIVIIITSNLSIRSYKFIYTKGKL